MYKSFRVKNYRGFDNLVVEPLERINLIAGKNNVGKTALLEALWLFHEYRNPALVAKLAGYRGLYEFKGGDFLLGMFRDFDIARELKMEASDSNDVASSLLVSARQKGSVIGPRESSDSDEQVQLFDLTRPRPAGTPRQLKWELIYRYSASDGTEVKSRALTDEESIRFYQTRQLAKPAGSFVPARASNDPGSLAERLSDVVETKETSKVVDALKIIEPRLNDLRVLQKGRYPVIYGDVGMKRLMPLPLLGEGMARILELSVAVPPARDGCLLVDEVENGLHHSVMKDIWKALARSVREFNVQFFATTHSHECIRAAHEAFSESDQYDFRLHRLELVDGAIRSVTYDQEALDFALEAGWEVR